MPFSGGLARNYQDERTAISEHELFNDHCMNIIQHMRNTRLVDSFSDNLEALTLRLDNIKLRFVIWLRSTHKLKPKSEKSVVELLTRLDLFLLHESETIRYVGAYGLIDSSEAEDSEDSSTQDDVRYSKLEACFRSYVNKYLEKNKRQYEIETSYNSWIVTDPVQCLDFLYILDTMVEDLFSHTTDDLSLALANTYVSFLTNNMVQEELVAVKKSGFSPTNLISQAAAKELSRLKAASSKMFPTASAQASLQDTAESSGSNSGITSTKAIPSNSVPGLDVAKRFAQIVERSRITQEQALRQEYPISQLAQRRVMAELRNADTSSQYISIACLKDDVSNLLGIVRGPPETPYANGVFFIKIDIPVRYPLQPAEYRFLTKIYHPNIDATGRVCANISGRDWSVGCALWGLLASILSLLAAPNPSDPLVSTIAHQYQNDRRTFEKAAQDWVTEYACKDWPTELAEPSTSNLSTIAETKTISEPETTSKSKSSSRSKSISDDWVDLDDWVTEF